MANMSELSLNDIQRTRAIQAVRGIADDFAALLDHWDRIPLTPQLPHTCEYDLASGVAGTVLFLSEATKLGVENAEAIVVEYAARLSKTVDDRSWSPSLFTGICGMAAAINHAVYAGVPQDDDPNSDFDDLFLQCVNDGSKRVYPDLINGHLGIGVYALARLPRPVAAATVSAVVTRLQQDAVRDARGVRWDHSGPDATPPKSRNRVQRLGVAHGSAGVVGFLAQVISAGVADDGIPPLLTSAVEFLQHELTASPTSSSMYDQEGPSWCWGDPGIALTIMLAADATGETGWRKYAHELGVASAQRAINYVERSHDICLCHGTIGVAYVFNRLYQTTQDPLFARVVSTAFERTLELRGRTGFGGFQFFRVLPDRSSFLGDSSGMLFGASGLGLALLSLTSPSALPWEAFLLAAAHPRLAQARE